MTWRRHVTDIAISQSRSTDRVRRHSPTEPPVPATRAGAARRPIAKRFGLEYGAAGELPGSRAPVSMRQSCRHGGKTTRAPHFVGIDASVAPDRGGLENRRRMFGLKNLRLAHVDILDIGQTFGEFDYIISHGVFFLVPTRVQNRFRDLPAPISPQGVAYISYQHYPRAHPGDRARHDVYRARNFSDPRPDWPGKALVGFVADATMGPNNTPSSRTAKASAAHGAIERLLSPQRTSGRK